MQDREDRLAVTKYPHPYDVILDPTHKDAPMPGLWQRQRARRAFILSKARKLVSDRGIGGFTVKELAGVSEMSPQTIYNIIGDRENILRASIDNLYAEAIRVSEKSGYGSLFLNELANIFVYWSHVTPEYHRNITLSYFNRDEPIHSAIKDHVIEKTVSHLGLGLSISGERYRMAVGELAICIHGCMAAAAFDWATYGCSDLEFAQRINNGTRLLLAA